MDCESLSAAIIQHLNAATQPITARELYLAVAPDVPMSTLANTLHHLRIEGKIQGERQEGHRAPLLYRKLHPGEEPNPAPRVAAPVKRGNGRGNGVDGSMDAKTELFEVIAEMAGDNHLLLRLIRVYVRL
ncbi:MAG: hypothetical protein ACREVK_05615 [Gammaproteobacteria bacterium]